MKKSTKTFHYIYCITNILDGMRYVGKRSSMKSPENDKYMGSGKHLKRAQKCHGIENFTKEILGVMDSEQEAFDVEKILVCQEIVDDKMWYNLQLGGKGGTSGRHISNETRKKMCGHTPHNKGRPRTKEECENISNGTKIAMNSISDEKKLEMKQKQSKTLKEVHHDDAWNLNVSKALMGKKKTPEHIKNSVEARRLARLERTANEI